MKHQNQTRKIALGLSLAIMLLPWSAQPQISPPVVQYTITDLGTLADCDVTLASSVNDSGSVAGYAYTFVPPGHGNSLLSRPFLWQSGTLAELPKVGGMYGQALAINAKGDLAGYAETVKYAQRPVTWSRANKFEPTMLSELPGRVTCLLDDGTAGGWIVGNKTKQAVMWKEGAMSLIGSPLNFESVCNGINDRGASVGSFIPERKPSQPVSSWWDRHAVMWKDGRQFALPELGGAMSECSAINEAEQAVGWADTKTGRNACLWQNGKVAALPTLQGYKSEAHSINRSGTIVGESMETAKKEGWRWLACLWRDGKMHDLNALVSADSGWKLSVATHICDTGLIVGYGHSEKYPTHTWRAFLLTPVSR